MQHQIHSFAEFRVLGNRRDVCGHSLADLASARMRVGLGKTATAQQELEPARAFFVRAELAAAQEIAFADDPNEPMNGVEHEKSADARAQQGFDRLGEGRGLGYADHAMGHHVPNPHCLVLA
jgi:hypothetical protein